MRKKINFIFIIFIAILTFSIKIDDLYAACYKIEYAGEKPIYRIMEDNNLGEVVNDYYCRVRECAIAVTESGNKPTTYIDSSGNEVGVKGCGGCGNGYEWDNYYKRCDVKLSPSNCAAKATSAISCTECDGYIWDDNKKSCVLKSTSDDTPSVDNATSCKSYEEKGPCEDSSKFSCIWNDNGKGYCNTDNLVYVQCGGAFDIPSQIPQIVSFVVNLLKIAVPIVLILVSIITLFKALFASKDDEITKAKNSLIKKIIAAVMVFFIIQIVQFVVSKVADDRDAENISTCLKCFLNNECEGSAYYKTNVAGTNICTNINSGEYKVCDGDKKSSTNNTNSGTTNNTNSGTTNDTTSSSKSNDVDTSYRDKFSGGGGEF